MTTHTYKALLLSIGAAGLLSGCVIPPESPSIQDLMTLQQCNNAPELYTNLALPASERTYSQPNGVACPPQETVNSSQETEN